MCVCVHVFVSTFLKKDSPGWASTVKYDNIILLLLYGNDTYHTIITVHGTATIPNLINSTFMLCIPLTPFRWVALQNAVTVSLVCWWKQQLAREYLCAFSVITYVICCTHKLLLQCFMLYNKITVTIFPYAQKGIETLYTYRQAIFLAKICIFDLKFCINPLKKIGGNQPSDSDMVLSSVRSQNIPTSNISTWFCLKSA